MTKQVRTTTHDGRQYQVITDEALKNEMLASYCQVYRIRKDGKVGARITDTMHVYHILKTVRAEG